MKKWSVQLVIVEKYVGELPADTARRSMFTDEYQRLDIINWNEKAIELLYDLMGTNADLRKKFIINNVDFSLVRE